ncbi:hypothetical protein NPX79_02695 [Spiroplasma endosymbiont of Anurida maritima]|uniref:ECF transporter S component n=1 Tax=Spiroplasma endosymbiont of Anurida maritima TaxID=2967972 RepID=UPI0036D3DA34
MNLLSFAEFSKYFYSDLTAKVISGILGVMFVVYCLYQGYIYKFKRSRYRGIIFNTRNIAYITLLSAASASITILISITVPITVFPPIRIAFEGVMVKISGFIFGPIVGVISAIVTDFIVMLFVPSFVHIAFILVIIFFGLVSGFVGDLYRLSNSNEKGSSKWFLFIFTNIFIIGFVTLTSLMTWYSDFPDGIPLFGGLVASKEVLVFLLILGGGLSIVVVWSITFIYRKYDKTKSKYQDVIAVILLCVLCEYLITSLISPWGDIAFLTVSKGDSAETSGYGVTLVARLAMAPMKIFFNVAVIYLVYIAVSPLVHRTNNN